MRHSEGPPGGGEEKGLRIGMILPKVPRVRRIFPPAGARKGNFTRAGAPLGDVDPFGSRLVTSGELFTLELTALYRHIRIGTAKPYGLGPVCRRWCHDASPFQTDPVA
jgi:hypothetical protein